MSCSADDPDAMILRQMRTEVKKKARKARNQPSRQSKGIASQKTDEVGQGNTPGITSTDYLESGSQTATSSKNSEGHIAKKSKRSDNTKSSNSVKHAPHEAMQDDRSTKVTNSSRFDEMIDTQSINKRYDDLMNNFSYDGEELVDYEDDLDSNRTPCVDLGLPGLKENSLTDRLTHSKSSGTGLRSFSKQRSSKKTKRSRSRSPDISSSSSSDSEHSSDSSKSTSSTATSDISGSSSEEVLDILYTCWFLQAAHA